MKIEWKSCLKIGLTVFLIYICIHYWKFVSSFISNLFGAALPLFIGCGIAYVVNILMTFYERHYFPKSSKKFVIASRRPVCLTAAALTLLAIIALIIGLVLPQLISCISLIIEKSPTFFKKMTASLVKLDFLPKSAKEFIVSIDWHSKIDQFTDVLTSGFGNVMGVVISTITSVFSGLVTAFLGIFFALYLLVSKNKLKDQGNRFLNRYFKIKTRRRVRYCLSIFNDCFHKYIVGQCTEAVILGVLCMIGMLILRIPYSAMIGALIAFTALIPIAGAYIGAGIGAFIIMTDSPIKALVFLIFIIILQQIEGNLIYPRVVGSSLGLPGIWVLAAITLGGGVMGITGMLLGVPLAASLYKIIQDDMHKTRRAKTLQTEADEE